MSNMNGLTVRSEDDGLPPPKIRRLLRVSADMTQVEMGAQVGVTAAAVSGWENGSSPRGAVRLAYAKLLRELRAELVRALIGHAY